MKHRLMGLETEYGLWGIDNEKEYFFIDRLLSFLKEIDPQHLILTEGSEGGDLRPIHWLSNGSKAYRDSGEHLEYATPECLSPRDIVICDRVGEIIIQRISKLCSEERQEKFVFLKNNVCDRHFSGRDGVVSNPVSWGSHENYLTSVSRETTFDWQLIPHLVTRIIYTGSGHLELQNDGSYSYVFSSRAGFIDLPFGNSATANRPFIMFRGTEPHADSNRFQRYQVVCGESNMLELPTYLKFLTTHLCLRLGEEGWRLPHRVVLKNDVTQFKSLNHDIYLENVLELMDGTFKKAIEIQRIYLEAAKELNPLSDEERHGLELCEWILGLLSCDLKNDHNLKKLFGVLDWATKWYLIKKEMEKRSWPINHPRILGINLRYHSLDDSPKESWWSFLNLKDKETPFIYRLVSDDDINSAVLNPPENSRAKIRSQFIKLASPLTYSFIKVKSFDWSRAEVTIGGENFKIEFGHANPFANSSESFEAFRNRLLNKSPVL